MKSTIEDGLRALREAAEQAKELRIELTDDYLALIDQLERLPDNRPDSDKSWVGRLLHWSAQHYGKAIRG